MLYVLIFALLALIVWRDILAFRERQNLLDRIMSRTYMEYRQAMSTPPEAVPYSDAEEYTRELNNP